MAVWKIKGSNCEGTLLEKVRQARQVREELPVYDIPNMKEAIGVIKDNLDTSIAIFGDYDCDGICGALILKRVFESLGVKVKVHLPTREEGYGIKPDHVKDLASQGFGTIITVDTGVAALDAAKVAQDLGINFIVTDHHEPQDLLPDCLIVNPKLRKDGFREYSGAGVAYLLGKKLLKSLGLKIDEDLIALASLATVVDMVPLIGPNFTMAREGLLRMRQKRSPGIQALMDVGRVKELRGHTFGWQLGPRINAAGRMGDPILAFELLEADNPEEARTLARKLDQLNRERQNIIARAVRECMNQYDGSMFPVFTCDYPPGIVGLVAGRIANQVMRPTIVGRIEGGVLKASGRSIGSFSILDALERAREEHQVIDKFGGHCAACGLEVEKDKILALQEVLNEIAQEELTSEDMTEWIDIEGIISRPPSVDEVIELDELEPHGQGNPEPTFLLRGRVDMVRRGDNWQLASTCGVKYFLDPQIELKEGQNIHLAISPYVNEYNGNKEVMGRVKDVKGTLLSRNTLLRRFQIWRDGDEISGLEEKVFQELGFTRTGEVVKSNLIDSKTFRKYGAL